IEEQMLPIEYWGKEYIGARAPGRPATTNYYWRIYGGANGVTVDVNPSQSGFPMTLAKGGYRSFTATTDVVFTGDGPFLPVQYVEGGGQTGLGDPSMILALPAAQYLNSYVFGTGIGYSTHVAQIVRPLGGADVLVDNVIVTGFTQLGSYEVANYAISEGSH